MNPRIFSNEYEYDYWNTWGCNHKPKPIYFAEPLVPIERIKLPDHSAERMRAAEEKRKRKQTE